MTRPRILVADDKENFLSLFRRIVGGTMDVTTASSGDEAIAQVTGSAFDVVVSDIRMPGADGHAVLSKVRQCCPDVEVILMTAYGSVADAVGAMKAGAFHYLTKPFDPDEALLLIERALERKRLREQARSLRIAVEGATRFEGMVGKSAAMQRVFQLLHRAAESDATVLITGESGTGKEVAARVVHQASPRRAGRFVAVNCGAIPEHLLESELFGHVRGAFTGAVTATRGLFEEASGGSIFLDELGDLPLPMQVKLNRVLQQRTIRKVGATTEQPIDIRVIAATNVDLKKAVEERRFREDLFYRMNVFPIRLPPLRERTEDIPLLSALFLDRLQQQRAGVPASFAPEALSAMLCHPWPGNVRELENTIERAVAICEGDSICLDALPEELTQRRPTPRSAGAELAALTYKQALELARNNASREYLIALLSAVHGNVTSAAERAGIERESLHRLLKKHGIRAEGFRERREGAEPERGKAAG